MGRSTIVTIGEFSNVHSSLDDKESVLKFLTDKLFNSKVICKLSDSTSYTVDK